MLVHEAIADALLERLAGAVEVLQVGPAERFGTDVPPVIEREAQERVERYAGAGRAARAVSPRAAGRAGRGLVRRADVAADLPAGLPRAARRDLRAAAGRRARARRRRGLRPRRRAALRADRRALLAQPATPSSTSSRRSPVGNLYVNRAITGAMVGRQPFGGNRLSGTGTKAGGPDYLLQFVEPRVVTENTMRHGLVV